MENLHFFVLVSFSHDLIAQLVLFEGDRDLYCAKIRLILNDLSGTIALSIFFLIQERHIVEKRIVRVVLFLLRILVQRFHISVIVIIG